MREAARSARRRARASATPRISRTPGEPRWGSPPRCAPGSGQPEGFPSAARPAPPREQRPQHRRTPLGRETVGERLEGVKPELSPVLGLDERPVVVPVRQKLRRQRWDRFGSRFRRRRTLGRREQLVGERPCIPEIHGDLLGQPEVPCGGFDRRSCSALQSGEGGSKTGGGAVLGRDRPQCPCHRLSLDQPSLQCEEGQEALGSFGKDDRGAIRLQLEPTQERDPRTSLTLA